MKLWHRLLAAALVLIPLAAGLILIAPARQDSMAAGEIVYVDAGATTGSNNGSSWQHAFTDLQAGLDVAGGGDQIWVAEGVYTPTAEHGGSGDRFRSFQLKNGVALYGGFDPSVGDTEFEDRNWILHRTILSGDLDGDDGPDFANNEENAYHVFYHPEGTDLDSSAILDGFTITGGNANGDYPHHSGGGMYNYGSSPTLIDCTFAHNRAGSDGGGMYNHSSSPGLTNSSFYDNSAGSGGGMANDSYSSPTLTNCTLHRNSASGQGGAIANVFISEPTLTNCILWGDTPEEIANLMSTATVTYSDIQGGHDGEGNVDADPLFVDAANGDLRLQLSSPAVDAGDNEAPNLDGVSTDLGGQARFVDVHTVTDTGNGDPPIVDMGAYEAFARVIYVDQDALGANDGSSWEDAFAGLQDGLDAALAGDEIWVAAGTYTPSQEHTPGDPRSASFQLKNGVQLYGGFDPTAGASDFEDRDWGVHETVISGDLNGDDGPDLTNNGENSYHVLYHPAGTDLDGSAILDGFIISGGNADAPPHTYGGGIYNEGSSPTLTHCTISGNAAHSGGGMANLGSSPRLVDCTFAGNSGTLGGGMYNLSNSEPELIGCTFWENSGYRGGGMNNWSSSPELVDCTFEENTAHTGGGIDNDASSPTLSGCAFEGNSADNGGGMFNANGSSPTVTGCTFTENSASEGGGMHNWESSPTLNNCTFEGNSAPFGGGMYNIASSPALSTCTFSGNEGSFSAGGMDNRSSTPVLTDCTFEGNVFGGMTNFDSSPALTNCSFVENSYVGIYNRGSSPTLTNCTFSGNSGEYSGGGLYNDESSSPALTNCILWGDTPYEITNVDAGSIPLVTYSDVQGGYAGAGNIDADPLFVDPAGGDYHLDHDSPCIDSGDNGAANLPQHDFEGDGRVLDGDGDGTATVDMGIDEVRCIHYVDAGAIGAGNGSSWEDAYTDLQDGLDIAKAGDQVWVAEGIYTPTREFAPGDPRSVTFQLKNGVALYGGFDPAAGDVGFEDRDWVGNVTILSGDIGSIGVPIDNAYHVFYHPPELALDSTAVLDGFTITGGYSDSDTIPNDRGGGMYNEGASPAVSNCTFSNNSAYYVNGVLTGFGGGMYNGNASPAVSNCTFSNNSAFSGGGMANFFSSSPAVINCVFENNVASFEGGGMVNYDSSPVVTNCTFSDNRTAGGGSDGGGMLNGSLSLPPSPEVDNCIFWGNSPNEISGGTPVITYSDIQGGCEAIPGADCGVGNIDADPLFVDAGAGDLRLKIGSPAIDAGDDDAPGLVGISSDLGGYPRFVAAVDMGAHETPPAVLLVDLDASGENDGTSWDSAFVDLQDALDWARDGVEVWVAAGVYRPTVERDGSGDRYRSFQLRNGVALYGGFDPSVGATTFEDRDWVLHQTVLSGDLKGDDGPDFANNAENAYHVFYHTEGTDLDHTAVLDGFVISGGNADSGGPPHETGGGMYNVRSSPTLRNCEFAGNSARYGGGGMYNAAYSSPLLTNCTFRSNTAGSGAGMYNTYSSPALTNCTFHGNLARYQGGGLFGFFAMAPTLTNCILWGDAPDEISNFAGGAIVLYSDIQGGHEGEGNIDADPLFVNADNGDLHLRPGSPCIDAGTNDAPQLPGHDFEGDPRILDGDGDGQPVVDMGVDEVRLRVYLPLVLKGY